MWHVLWQHGQVCESTQSNNNGVQHTPWSVDKPHLHNNGMQSLVIVPCATQLEH